MKVTFIPGALNKSIRSNCYRYLLEKYLKEKINRKEEVGSEGDLRKGIDGRTGETRI